MRALPLLVAALAPLAALALAPSPASAQSAQRVITFDTPKRHNSLVVFARPTVSVSLAPGATDLRIWLNGDLVTSRFKRTGNRWSARVSQADGLKLGRNTLSVGADDSTGERKTATRIFRAVRQDKKGVLVARPAQGQAVTSTPLLTIIRTRGDLSEFRVWLNKREVTGLFGPATRARVDGYVVRRARIPSGRGLRPAGNVLKVRAVSDDFRHQTVFRTFQATPAAAA